MMLQFFVMRFHGDTWLFTTDTSRYDWLTGYGRPVRRLKVGY